MTMDMAAGLELAVAILASKNIQFRYNAHPATATVDWLLPYISTDNISQDHGEYETAYR
jgi:hypothetical protein